MDDIYVNVEAVKSVDSRPPRSPTGARRFHGAVLILGLLTVLLLSGLIGLGVCFVEVSSITANLTERLQDTNNQVSSLNGDREQLRANLSEVTEERNRLRRAITQTGWTTFNKSLYFLSNEPGSWTRGRDDCIKREAHLVVIDSDEEQRFLSGFSKEAAWIGLSDRDKEGTWGWIDGAPLTVRYWWKNQPDNGEGLTKEDCAHISALTAEWNDLSCEMSLLWICEKTF